MAIQRCPACGTQVHHQVTECPRCGGRLGSTAQRAKSALPLVLLAVFVLALGAWWLVRHRAH
jgi:uncharacterized paraquat-inducible protein A